MDKTVPVELTADEIHRIMNWANDKIREKQDYEALYPSKPGGLDIAKPIAADKTLNGIIFQKMVEAMSKVQAS